VAYYLQKGFKLEYLLNLGGFEQMFFKASMEQAIKQKVEYDSEKLKVIARIVGGR
jgi:hypothetical protein